MNTVRVMGTKLPFTSTWLYRVMVWNPQAEEFTEYDSFTTFRKLSLEEMLSVEQGYEEGLLK